jgi:hypothetical protein
MAISTADPNAFLAVGMQSALGTPQTTAGKLRFAKYLSGTNFNDAPEVVFLREGGDGLDWGFGYKKSQKTEGQIVINLRPEITGQLFQGMPAGATWGGASLMAQHIFMTGHASFPWMTLFCQFPGSTMIHMISDVLFTGFTVEAMSGEPLKLTLPFIGINHGASAAAIVPTYINENPFIYHFNPSYQIDGAADSAINSWKIDAGLGIEELQAQSFKLDDIAVQNRDFNFEVTRRYTNSSQWSKILFGGGIVATNTVPTGAFRAYNNYGATPAFASIDFNLPLIGYADDNLTELDPDGKTVYETVTGKALKSATHAMIVTLNNTHASAYAS